MLMALALAAQPWSVLAGIILVAAHRGVAKEVAYVVGWIAALSTVMAITVAMSPDTPSTSDSTAPAAAEIALGLALGLLLAVRWRRTAGTTAPTPSWMGRLDTMPWVLALVLGAFLPNYFIVVAAATEMLQIGPDGSVPGSDGGGLRPGGVPRRRRPAGGAGRPSRARPRGVRRVADVDPGQQPVG